MGILITISGILMCCIGFIWSYRLNKYEFHHRKSENVIEHESFDDANWHNLSKGLARVLIIGGLLIGLYGHFLYDPYRGHRPANWGSMSSESRRQWELYFDNKLSHRNLHTLIKDKEFENWAKALEKETGISHLHWRDISDSTDKHTSFQDQKRLMIKNGYTRMTLRAIKYTYEKDPDPNYYKGPLGAWRKEMEKRTEQKKELEN